MNLFPILNSNDRLAITIKSTNKIMPLKDFNSSLASVAAVESLYDQIELLNFQLLDQQSETSAYKSVHDDLVLHNEELKANLDRMHITESTKMELQVRINQLTQDLATEMSNRDHFRELVSQQDTFIEELKAQVEKWKDANSKELQEVRANLESKTGETEHLAKKAIEMNQQIVSLTNDNNSFRKQNNSLLEEIRKHCDRAQDMDKRLSQSTTLIESLKKTLADQCRISDIHRTMISRYFSMICIMTPFISGFAHRWFGNSKSKRIIYDTDVLQQDIDRLDASLLKNLDEFKK